MAGERDAVTVGGQIIVAATKRWLFAELVVDTAIVQEVKDPVSAADYGLSIAKQVIGSADARTKCVVVLINDAARNAVLSCFENRTVVHVK